MHGKITRTNVIEADWKYLQQHCSSAGEVKLKYNDQRKAAL